jgi:integrase/recombinase XerD
METVFIDKRKNIIFALERMQEESFSIIKRLNGKELLKAYLYLEELYSKISDESIAFKDKAEIPDSKTILERYRLHLESSANSKNTINDYCREIGRFLDYHKDTNTEIDSLNAGFLNSYLYKQKTKRKLSINSYSRLVIVIRSFLSYLYKEKIIIKPLALELKTPRRIDKERECLTDSEIQKILSYLENRKERYKGENIRDLLVFMLGVSCGLRKSEIAKLNWEDVDFNERKLKILEAKGGKERVVYYNQKVEKVMEDYIKRLSGNAKGALVRGSFGKRITSCPLHRIIRRIYVESGIYKKGLTVHSLRYPNLNKIQTF